MIKRNRENLKNSKPFYPFDLILYGVLAAFVAAAFLIVLSGGTQKNSHGFYVLYDNAIAAEYSYSDGEFKIKDGYAAHFSIEEEKIFFYPEENDFGEYNIIIIDKENKTVYISDATCAGKDCTAQKVSDKGGFIYCAPHKLKIIPMGQTDPVSG